LSNPRRKKGKVTLGAGRLTGKGKQGNISIDGAFRCAHNPLAGSSDDVLGFIAENCVLVANNKKDINTQASFFAIQADSWQRIMIAAVWKGPSDFFEEFNRT
jgi:hypothetical protein